MRSINSRPKLNEAGTSRAGIESRHHVKLHHVGRPQSAHPCLYTSVESPPLDRRVLCGVQLKSPSLRPHLTTPASRECGDGGGGGVSVCVCVCSVLVYLGASVTMRRRRAWNRYALEPLSAVVPHFKTSTAGVVLEVVKFGGVAKSNRTYDILKVSDGSIAK
ncbi:uncharacterized protein LOC123500486 [Portunus trituberculatus]|uniref:uncharacterized protein LOC123500486 n=1 Tax=Portunus trituberculatus TaxID=210409 RepID=UPI001E1D08AB|nr:uncharacterized protein LOC123500486 [Portunus trituberculatus]